MTSYFISSKSTKKKKRATRHRIITLFTLFLLGLWYLIAVNAVVASSYRLSDTVATKEKLSREMEILKAQIASVSAPESFEIKAKELGFLPVISPKYLSVPGTTVAKR